jgi:adenylate cyclase
VADVKNQSKGGIERERKYLVNRLPPGLSRRPHRLIEQGYLDIRMSDGKSRELRIRRDGNDFVLTIKAGKGRARQEEEAPIPRSAARLLWPLTKGRRLKKVRYEIPYDGLTIELDVYRGRLRGLRIAEVEFASDAGLRRFEPPDWFGKEVTGVKSFTNSELAANGWRNRRSFGR